jgi:diguanylate cyclase
LGVRDEGVPADSGSRGRSHSGVPGRVRGLGALLLAAEVAFIASLVLDGLVLPVDWWDRWVHPALNLGAAALVLLRVAARPRHRGPWSAIAAGLVCSAVGDLYYSLALFGRESAQFPSPDDLLYLLSYLGFYGGLGLLVRAASREFHPSMWLDGILAGLGVAAVGALAFGPIAAGEQQGTGLVILLAYPSADLLLVSLVVGVLAARGWSRSGPWVLLATACTVNAVADTGYLLLTATGTYADGSIVDAMWSGAYLLLAAAAWRPDPPDRTLRLEGGRLLVVPVLVTIIALLVLLGDVLGPVPLIAQLLAAGAIGTVLVRTALTFREVAAFAETRRAARTDDLTGLSNRRDFYGRVTAITAAGPAPVGSAVLLIDLDRFKDVNDSLGHQVGDQLLVLVARRLVGQVRDTDTVGRLGGDEFAVLLTDTGLDDASRTAGALRARLREPFVIGPSTLYISGSVGIAAHPEHASDVHGLLRCADTAMYAAKTAGGVQVYDPGSSEDARRNLQSMQELRAAIETASGRAAPGPAGTLRMRYQPKLDLRTGRVNDFEVLVRWEHPRRGLVSPQDFLALAERAGLMGPLTEAVLHQALAQCRTWRAAGREVTVAVNVSATSLVGFEFVRRIHAALTDFEVPPSALVLEITESAIMSDKDRSFAVLRSLSALGVRLAVDDYGTGYSSLSYLQDLPVDELKLDRSFISRMVSDQRTAAIVFSTIGLAHSLGLPVVAEGVETPSALDMLTEAGCDYGQGYLIATPLTAHEVTIWLDRVQLPVPTMRGPI